MIYITQLLCPERHCVFGMAFDDADMTKEEAITGLRELFATGVAQGHLNPWCGICGSHDLTFNLATSKCKTMEELRPHLKSAEANNLVSRILSDAAGGIQKGESESEEKNKS